MVQSERERCNQAINELADYHGKDPALTDHASLRAMFEKESDRGLIIILITWIEDALVDRICSKLPNGEELRKTLKHGPMRAFEHRIAIARATGVISETQAETLDLFRHMRNACAHCRREISFKTPQLRAVFAEMFSVSEGKKLIIDPPEHESQFMQGIFMLAATMMLNMLMGLSREDYKATVDDVLKEMEAEGRPDEIDTERVLFRALQKKLTSKQAPDSHRPTSGKGR